MVMYTPNGMSTDAIPFEPGEEFGAYSWFSSRHKTVWNQTQDVLGVCKGLPRVGTIVGLDAVQGRMGELEAGAD